MAESNIAHAMVTAHPESRINSKALLFMLAKCHGD
jgi:hypothetical protein